MDDNITHQLRKAEPGADGIMRLDLLPPKPGNPRNSEGSFIELANGDIMFVYSRFREGAGDHAAADLAARFSPDRGRSWSREDHILIPNEAGANIMSASLLRMQDGRIALFYIQKNSLVDCRPVMRCSSDEAQSWSEPVKIVSDTERGYYVVNNDRVIQLESGRLLVPAADHGSMESSQDHSHFADIVCYFSDDGGESWSRGRIAPVTEPADGHRVCLQEPGVVELKNGRILIFCRTKEGVQYSAHSEDGGETWSALAPSNMSSPCSPASIKRIPDTQDLLLIWNDHSNIAPELSGKRTPLVAAISRDERMNWQNKHVLADDPDGWYCYTAIEFIDDHVLLGHCAGNREKNNGLAVTRITRFPVHLMYNF